MIHTLMLVDSHDVRARLLLKLVSDSNRDCLQLLEHLVSRFNISINCGVTLIHALISVDILCPSL